MILLLNLIPIVLLAVMVLLLIKRRWTLLAVAAAVSVLYVMAQPSYLPKSSFSRGELPAFEASSATVEDRSSKPMNNDERDARMKQAVQEGLVFK